MILNVAKIGIKNDTMIMVSNMPNIHKLCGQTVIKRNTGTRKVSEQRIRYPTIAREDPSSMN
jgi:hypothetical protein